jgi:hypothetical protein
LAQRGKAFSGFVIEEEIEEDLDAAARSDVEAVRKEQNLKKRG